MKKVFLVAIMLIAFGSATMAQTSTGKHHSKKHHKVHHMKAKVGKTQK